jgi:hypothetical protein
MRSGGKIMLTCEQVKALMKGRLPFDATVAERSAIRNHVQKCPKCQEEAMKRFEELLPLLSPRDRLFILSKIPELLKVMAGDANDPESSTSKGE